VKINKRFLGFVPALMLLGGNALAAELVTNGNFQTSANIGAFENLSAGSTAINGWTVTNGSIDWIGTYWQAPPSGGKSLDMDGNHPGAVSQTLELVLGQTYTVSFYLAGNPAIHSLKTLDVQLGSDTQQFTFNSSGKNFTSMGWVLESFTTTYTGGPSSITFASKDAYSSLAGPAIGGVSVTSTPLPAALFFVAPALAGVFGFSRRKANNSLQA